MSDKQRAGVSLSLAALIIGAEKQRWRRVGSAAPRVARNPARPGPVPFSQARSESGALLARSLALGPNEELCN